MYIRIVFSRILPVHEICKVLVITISRLKLHLRHHLELRRQKREHKQKFSAVYVQRDFSDRKGNKASKNRAQT